MKNRILVVDDEKEIADLVEIYLVSEKFDVIKCYDGDIAIDAIEHEKIDLAILDIMLPGIDGFEVCRELRAQSDTIGIIFLTVLLDNKINTEEDVTKYLDLTVVGVIPEYEGGKKK